MQKCKDFSIKNGFIINSYTGRNLTSLNPIKFSYDSSYATIKIWNTNEQPTDKFHESTEVEAVFKATLCIINNLLYENII